MSKFFSSEETRPLTGHVLPYTWNVWHHNRYVKQETTTEDSSQKMQKFQPLDEFLLTTTKVSFPRFDDPSATTTEISTLEQLFIALNELKFAGDLSPENEIYIFKEGIRPVWEDPINTQGGKSCIKAKSTVPDESKSLLWENLVLRTLGGCLIAGNDEELRARVDADICGLVFSARKREFMVAIWNQNADEKEGETQDALDTMTSDDFEQLEKDILTQSTRSSRTYIFLSLKAILENTRGMNKKTANKSLFYKFHKYRLKETSGRPHSEREHHNSRHGGHRNNFRKRDHYTNSHGHRYNKDRDSSSIGAASSQGDRVISSDKPSSEGKFVFSDLGRSRRGLDNSVEGGTPSGLLFGSRRKQLAQDEQA